jgi:hypothetical protein
VATRHPTWDQPDFDFQPPASVRRVRPGPRRRRSPRHRRIRRIATTASLLALLPALISYVSTMSGRSDSSFSIRSLEWVTSNGGRGLVNRIETIYYSLSAPSKGGPALKQLPNQPGTATAGRGARPHVVRHYEPPNIKPVIKPALPGEGVWRSTFRGRSGPPPVMVTSFRSDPSYPQLVAGVAWIDHTQTTTWLYPGIQEPSVPMAQRGPEEVPTTMRDRLVATFNSGFKLADSGGGFAYGGHTYTTMKDGLGTFVRYTDGSVDVIDWTGGSTIASDIVYARQNLPLIVSGGQLNSNLSTGPEWGATLGNAVQVWRSSVGVDKYGNLIYAAANYQTVASLARIMQHAGAVRAMEMDINAYWPSFITYQRAGAIGARNLLPDMTRSPLRYLTPDDRDFFAVYLNP